MGNLCGKSSRYDEGDRLIGRSQAGTEGTARPNPREAAAAAAENRMKTAQNRGVQSNNPQGGRLAAQLEASKSGGSQPQQELPERVVWD